MTTLVPVEDPEVLRRLNGGGSPPTDGQQAPEGPGKFLGGTKENWMDQIPSTLSAAGGITGALVGGGVGGGATAGVGAIPGVIAGGALGASGGQYAGDLILNILKRGGIYQGGQEKPVESMVTDAAKTGAVDAGLSMGVPIAGRVYQGAKSAALGIGQQGIDAFRNAGEQGINLGITDVAQRALPRMYEKVIGSFPLMGGPSRRAYDRKIGEVERAAGNIVHSTGTPRGISESGREMVGAAEDTYKAFRSQVDEKYKAARDLATSGNPIIPPSMGTDTLRETAGKIVADWDAQAVKGIERTEPPVIQKAREITSMPDRMSFQQYEGMADELDRLIEQSRRDGFKFKRAVNVSDALERDLATLDHEQARAAFADARRFFAEERKKFDTVTGQQFGKVDRNMFRPGFEKPGSLNPDELFTRVFDTKSPQAMKELKDLVGDEAFGNALATHIERKLTAAVEEQAVRGDPRQVLSGAKAIKALGLSNPKSPEFAALSAAFNVSGRPEGIRALKQFLDSVVAATDRGAPNLSQFLARRATMGGLRGLENALPIGATAIAAGTGGAPAALTTIMGFFAANRLSHRLSDPRFLREMAIVINPKNPTELREAVLRRVLSTHTATPLVTGNDPNGR